MNKEELRVLIDSMDTYYPISIIEKMVGIPNTTLQKALKSDEKKLPKKWVKPLINFCKYSPEINKEIPTTESLKPAPSVKEIQNFDFGDDPYLLIEKYTKFPMKNRPMQRVERYRWDIQKEESDLVIKAEWEKHKHNK